MIALQSCVIVRSVILGGVQVLNYFGCGTLLVSILIAGSAAAADSWINARATTSGSCNAQLETSRPILGVILSGKYATRKEACVAAKALKTDDAADANKCFDYTSGTISGCKADGVSLP